MTILIQYSSLCFIPLLSILIFNGLTEIYYGLKNYYEIKNTGIIEMKYKYSSIKFCTQTDI